MKARVLFYCFAVVALVLFLAATSHATERRDPVVNPEQAQPAPARGADSTKPAHNNHSRKSTHLAAKPLSQAKVDQKKSPDSGVGTAGNGK